jgi:hypothetical protein
MAGISQSVGISLGRRHSRHHVTRAYSKGMIWVTPWVTTYVRRCEGVTRVTDYWVCDGFAGVGRMRDDGWSEIERDSLKSLSYLSCCHKMAKTSLFLGMTVWWAI